MRKKRNQKGISLDILSDYYDLLTFTEKSRFRKNQIDLMEIKEGERVLEVGCGTGVLSILSKVATGRAGEVEGIDIAPRMIQKAQQKTRDAMLDINFQVAGITELPYPDNAFDLVISSLMFHHLPVQVKKEGLQEIYRVLKENGRLFLCDVGPPGLWLAPFMFLLLIWISPTRYQFLGKLPGLIRACNFKSVDLIKKSGLLKYYMIKKS